MDKNSQVRSWKVGEHGVRLTSIPSGVGTSLVVIRDRDGMTVIFGASELLAMAKVIEGMMQDNLIFAANYDFGQGKVHVSLEPKKDEFSLPSKV
jgi:hypothetical protein